MKTPSRGIRGHRHQSCLSANITVMPLWWCVWWCPWYQKHKLIFSLHSYILEAKKVVMKIMVTEIVYFLCNLIVFIDQTFCTRPNNTKKSQVSLNGHWLCFFVLNKSFQYLYQSFPSPTICTASHLFLWMIYSGINNVIAYFNSWFSQIIIR